MQSLDQTLPVAGIDIVAGVGDRGRRIKAIVGASSGNLVEWYDFYTYAFTSIYFAAAFFPDFFQQFFPLPVAGCRLAAPTRLVPASSAASSPPRPVASPCRAASRRSDG